MQYCVGDVLHVNRALYNFLAVWLKSSLCGVSGDHLSFGIPYVRLAINHSICIDDIVGSYRYRFECK